MTINVCFELTYPTFVLNADLQLPGKGVTALFGHSGSGKTTLLRCIAGLERASGHLTVLGETWQHHNFFQPPHKRPLGYVFQEAHLFPHLTVIKNLHYGLKRIQSDTTPFQLDHAIELLGIDHLLQRKPQKLSGGERQRVAIARALAVNPKILLMDEPLAALDLARKKEILPFLEKLHDTLNIPILYVTHSPDEVARLADHLVVMSQGRILANGALTETMARLDLPLLQGEEAGAVLTSKIIEKDTDWHLCRADFGNGSLWVKDMGFNIGDNIRLRVLARDVSISLQPATNSSLLNTLPATVCNLADGDHPATKIVQLRIGKACILCRLTNRSFHHLELKVGKSIWAQIKSVAVID